MAELLRVKLQRVKLLNFFIYFLLKKWYDKKSVFYGRKDFKI